LSPFFSSIENTQARTGHALTQRIISSLCLRLFIIIYSEVGGYRSIDCHVYSFTIVTNFILKIY